jgi:exopolysaccharide production protein ExoZ
MTESPDRRVAVVAVDDTASTAAIPAAAVPTAAVPAPAPTSDVSTSAGDARAATPRYEGVQVLRFVAALAVVVTHATFYTHERLDRHLTVWDAGTAGVDIFFVISGFVIVVSSRRLIGRAGGGREFAARRLIRIVPLYWIATTVNLVVLLLLPGQVLHSRLDWWNVTSSYLFLPSYTSDGQIEPLLGVGWTLTFEMFFYAVFAAAILLRRNVYVVVGLVMGACAVGALWHTPGGPAIGFYLSPRVLEFYLGMLLALVSVRLHPGRTWAALCLGAGLVLLFVAPLDGYGLPLLLRKGLPALLVVAGAVFLEPHVGRRLPRALVFLGGASYALYLFHPMIAPAVPALLKHAGLRFDVLSVAGALVVAVAAASVVHAALERPLTRRLNRAWRERRAQVAERPVAAGSPVGVGE